MHPHRHARTMLAARLFGAAVLAAAAALLWAGRDSGATATASKVPARFFGVSPQKEPSQAEFQRMRRNGADSVRFGIPWNAIETSPGSFSFAATDPYVRRSAEAGLEAFPFLAATPDFYAGNCSPADCFTRMPVSARQKNAWARFLRAAVRRYGPRGSFWAQNPGVPKRPIRRWQIWNESNFVFFTRPRSPRRYAQLVKVSHAAIRGVDRRAKVILAGLFGHPKRSQGQEATAFLNGIYRVPGIKRSFEGVALHPYAKDASLLRPDIRSIRRVMRRHGDGGTALYLTEIGWGDGRGTAFEKGPRGQVRELAQAYRLLRRMQRPARLQRTFWFSWDDLSGSCNFCDSTGLVRENGSAKPSLARFRSIAKGH